MFFNDSGISSVFYIRNMHDCKRYLVLEPFPRKENKKIQRLNNTIHSKFFSQSSIKKQKRISQINNPKRYR